MKSDILINSCIRNKKKKIKMIICNGHKIHDLDYDVTRHWIHLLNSLTKRLRMKSSVSYS